MKLIELCMYVMEPGSISAMCFISHSHQSVCMYIVLLLGKGSIKRYSGNECTRNNGRIVGWVDFFAVRVVLIKVGYELMPINLNRRVVANCTSKLQTRHIVREGAPQHEDRKYLTVVKKSGRGSQMGPDTKTDWPTDHRSLNNVFELADKAARVLTTSIVSGYRLSTRKVRLSELN
jgi:hypothetical protein